MCVCIDSLSIFTYLYNLCLHFLDVNLYLISGECWSPPHLLLYQFYCIYYCINLDGGGHLGAVVPRRPAGAVIPDGGGGCLLDGGGGHP